MRKSFLMALSVCLSGCASVKTTTTIYHSDDFSAQGKTYGYVTQSDQNNLQFEYVTQLVDAELHKYGFRRNTDAQDYKITLNYGTGGPQYQQVMTPVYGQTGYVGAFWPGPAYPPYGPGGIYYQPSYGVVGSVPVTVTRYLHYFTMNIYPKTSAISHSNAQPVYTLQAQTLSATNNLAFVLPAMIQAVFSEFTAKSGTVFSKSIRINAQTGTPSES